jgi:16S rRNA (cytidine1402-2'-O)-methyltransferase
VVKRRTRSAARPGRRHRAAHRAPQVVAEPAPQSAAGRGTLSLVATPIGNLEDLAPRARAALAAADLVACEDTRHSGMLLSRLGIARPLLSLHEHNERQRLPRLLAALAAGQRVALVSDAGMPLISDPGLPLVRAAIAAGHRVEAVSGPAALLLALVVSGLPSCPFTFVGFPPPRQGPRRRFLAALAPLDHTLVLYEAPHRILATLEDAASELGDRPAALARELTKLHEEVLRGSLRSLAATLAARPAIKGEMVLVIGGPGAWPIGSGPAEAADAAAPADLPGPDEPARQ